MYVVSYLVEQHVSVENLAHERNPHETLVPLRDLIDVNLNPWKLALMCVVVKPEYARSGNAALACANLAQAQSAWLSGHICEHNAIESLEILLRDSVKYFA